MWINVKISVVLGVVMLLSMGGCGCGYTYRDIEFVLTDRETGEPAMGVELCSTSGFALFCWSRAEEDWATTDRDGRAVLRVAVKGCAPPRIETMVSGDHWGGYVLTFHSIRGRDEASMFEGEGPWSNECQLIWEESERFELAQLNRFAPIPVLLDVVEHGRIRVDSHSRIRSTIVRMMFEMNWRETPWVVKARLVER